MTAACHCEAHGTRPSDGPGRQWLHTAGSAIPGVIAILLPKCPLCVAAWVAAATGVALPAIVTTHLRPALWILCALSAALALHHVLIQRKQSRSRRKPASTWA